MTNPASPSIGIIKELLEPYVDLPLECDGMTRVISYILKMEKIPHKVFIGTLVVKGQGEFSPHFWIRLGTGEIIDYRSRMWFGGDMDIPQGIFKEDGKAGMVSYDGREIDLPVSKAVFSILTGG